MNNQTSQPDNPVGHSLENSKLQEEIRSLKQQRLIGIISAIGAVVAFCVINYTNIMGIFYPPPKIKLIVNDPYVKRNGSIKIKNIQNESEYPNISTSVDQALDWIPLKEGSYRLVLSVNDKDYFKEDLFLNAGDRDIVTIPERNDQTIDITVYNSTPNPPPGSPLHLQIESSGNGYLWIYDLPAQDNPALIYPAKDAAGERHKINVGQTYQIPDSEKHGIFVADQLIEENLLVIVTSSNSLSIADKIAASMSRKTVSKASSGTIDENWGISILTYKVGK
jgi:hypothetical protein